MSKKKRVKRPGRIRHLKEKGKDLDSIDSMAPLAERYKGFGFKDQQLGDQWLGHGIEAIDVEVLAGGQVVGRAHINRLERSALDGLEKAGILNDPRDSAVAQRRKAAGIVLWETWVDADIETPSSARYDKVTGEMMCSGPPAPKSNHALNREVEYYHLMRVCSPFHTVVSDVCCYNQQPRPVVWIPNPSDTRLGQTIAWHEALRRGLDRIADTLFGKDEKPQRRYRLAADTLPIGVRR